MFMCCFEASQIFYYFHIMIILNNSMDNIKKKIQRKFTLNVNAFIKNNIYCDINRHSKIYYFHLHSEPARFY